MVDPVSGGVCTQESTTRISDEELEEFVNFVLPDKVTCKRGGKKVIHDGLWGTVRVHEWEVALLDTRLLQRLRWIHQTGFTHYTYPSSTHSRFEHTLGVLHNVYKLGTALSAAENGELRVDEKDLWCVRVAALLHDIGHGPFSHTTEEIYGSDESFATLKEELGAGSAHELLAYRIIHTKKFKTIIDQIEDACKIDLSIEKAANFIIGRDTDPTKPFHRELINGPFDGDKLDYLFRDSHFTGLPLSVDVDRLLYTIRIAKVQDAQRLVVTASGATPLEQILFSKMGLYASVYQHHKVRACDCMLAGIIEFIKAKSLAFKVYGKRIDFTRPTDYLWLTDLDVPSLSKMAIEGDQKDIETLAGLLDSLHYRRFIKRALIISKATIALDGEGRLDEFFALGKKGLANTIEKRRLARLIWEKAGKPCLPEEIWLDIPMKPNFNMAAQTFVIHNEQGGCTPVSMNDLFPSDQWAQLYDQHKLRGHVFCPEQHVEIVAKAAREILESEYVFKFRQEAFLWCKINISS